VVELTFVPVIFTICPEHAHVLVAESIRSSVNFPVTALPAATETLRRNPTVDVFSTVLAADRSAHPDVYAEVSTPPLSPIRRSKFDVPLVDTPLSKTVIRFAHDGIPVKLTAVPEVVAARVPAVRWVPLIATGVPAARV